MTRLNARRGEKGVAPEEEQARGGDAPISAQPILARRSLVTALPVFDF
jgi:hypothetical protein